VFGLLWAIERGEAVDRFLDAGPWTGRGRPVGFGGGSGARSPPEALPGPIAGADMGDRLLM